MNIQLLSDLHLEVHPHWVATPAAGADVLVLAGDIGSYQSGSLLSGDDFGLARFSPLLGWPTPVFYVPGNHEYDGLDFEDTRLRLRATCARLGITWLDREVVVCTDSKGSSVRFMGTTLWTDFDALVPAALPASVKTPYGITGPGLLTQQLKARDKAFRAANYYLRKNTSLKAGEPMLAEAIREEALICQAWLVQALAQPFEGKTAVVTHFAPSLGSADPRYGLTPGTAGFCNNLDHLLGQAQLWLHGHLHAPSDYSREGCRVVANPLGYARKNEQLKFHAAVCIEL